MKVSIGAKQTGSTDQKGAIKPVSVWVQGWVNPDHLTKSTTKTINISKNDDVFLLVGGNLGKNVYELGVLNTQNVPMTNLLADNLEGGMDDNKVISILYYEKNIEVIIMKKEDNDYNLTLILDEDPNQK